ncbi:MAG: efflux RND transporter periplasmic adaptor subunit [Candidatus Cloacimonetes bacterium]|nr:efflux RND transporter periplasmic adaptor subunit [Candidatus Cloacimonadota bacterium]
MRRRYWVIILMIFSLLLSCSIKKTGRKDKSGEITRHIVTTGEITVKLEETGEIQPIREIDIKSKVSGKVLKFYVEEGDYVNNGDIIAQIEPDYNQAEIIQRVKSNLELAEIRLQNARRNYNDKKKLFDASFISEIELDSYEDALAEAEINYNAAVQQYELIQEIDTEGNVTNIVSSADGTVIQKLVEEGEMVVASTSSFSEGTVVLKLADLDRMVVISRINEIDFSKIRKNQKVSIQVDAYPYQQFNGHITKIAAMASEFNNIKAFPIEIEIDKVDERLRPGMTANVTIIGERKKDIVVVPIRAIYSDEEGNDIVYGISGDTLSGPIVVKTGINNFQEVEIIEGLAVGDTISLTEPEQEAVDMEIMIE